MPSFERGAYEPSDDVRVFDASGDDEQEDEGSRLPLLIVIGLLVFAAFAGVVWLAYTQGVARGRQDAPRMIVADSGPVKVAPTNPGGTQTPYTGLKIYQAPAPAEDTNDDEAAPAPTPSSPAAQPKTEQEISPSLAPVIRPTQTDTTPKAPAASFTAPPPKAAVKKDVAKAAATPAATAPSTQAHIATKPPAKLSPVAAHPAAKPTITATETPSTPTAETPTESAAVLPAEKPAATTSGGAFVLQVGAYKSEDEANAAWKSYQAKHPLVGGYESDVKKVDLGAKGTWYRLRLGSFSDKAAAGALCAKLKADGGDCIPSKQ